MFNLYSIIIENEDNILIVYLGIFYFIIIGLFSKLVHKNKSWIKKYYYNK